MGWFWKDKYTDIEDVTRYCVKYYKTGYLSAHKVEYNCPDEIRTLVKANIKDKRFYISELEVRRYKQKIHPKVRVD